MNTIQIIRLSLICTGLIFITVSFMIKDKKFRDGVITGMWIIMVINNIVKLIEGE